MSEPEVEDFAAMFEASVKTRRFSRGQAIEGTIVAIGPDTSLVNVGGKGEAVIETADLKDHENDLEFAVGDRLQAIVVGTTGGITLSRKGIRGAASLVQLDHAYQAGLPVEGKVEREVKGGYEVRVAGQRGFCPFSQIDTVRTADPAQHIGQTYSFRIIEFKDGGKNLVVSRRALLEDGRTAQALEALCTLDEDAGRHAHEFLELRADLDKTMVLVTHDLAEACRLADRIALLSRGRILQVGSAEDLRSAPASAEVEAFLGGGALG